MERLGIRYRAIRHKVGRTGVSCIESRGHSCLRTKLLIIDGETTDINPILNLSELLKVSRE